MFEAAQVLAPATVVIADVLTDSGESVASVAFASRWRDSGSGESEIRLVLIRAGMRGNVGPAVFTPCIRAADASICMLKPKCDVDRGVDALISPGWLVIGGAIV